MTSSSLPRAARGLNPPAGPSLSIWLALMACFSVGVVGLALVSQYVFAMLPCPWCILQRIVFLLIAVVCALGAWLARQPSGWRLGAARLCSALAMAGAAGGVAAAWYQHEVASQLFSCNLTWADRVLMATGLEDAVPFLFRVEASCADGAVAMLGISYEFWSMAAFVMLGLAGLWALGRRLR